MNNNHPVRRRAFVMLMLCYASVAGAQTLHAPAKRISDQAVAADHAVYGATQARLQALNETGRHRLRDYYMSKAQCWLDVSVHEYTRNDRSAFPQESLSQSVAIIAALETGAKPNPGDATPLVNGAAKLRPDLWDRLASLKQHPQAACAAQHVACAEVELVHAGNEYRQQGWRHGNPYVQIAEDKIVAADAAAAACAPQNEPVAPAPQAPTAPPAPAPVVEKLSLSADTLFRFDRSGPADLLPAGREQIDRMMEKLDRVYARVERITLTGHTDRLGNERYNDALSHARAATVRAYLISKGAKMPIVTTGKGESQQIADCTAVTPRAALIACLQPNRRVEVEIQGEKR